MSFSNAGWLARLRIGKADKPDVDTVPQHPVRRTTIVDARGRSLVSRVRVRTDVQSAVQQALALLSEERPVLQRGESPLIVPRLGAGSYPHSTSPDFLQACITALYELGAARLRVLDLRSPGQPEPSGLEDVCALTDSDLVRPDDASWVRVELQNGGSLTVPRQVYDSERLVLLPTPLADGSLRFRMGLAHAEQLLHPDERRKLQRREERTVEANLAARPWLLLMDARKALVSDAPVATLREPGVVLASGDPIALDAAAVKLLKGYHAKNRLDMPAWAFPQMVHAIQLGLGAGREDDAHTLQA